MSLDRVQPAGRGARRVGTLEALLRIRQDMQRGRLFLHMGDALIERLAGYVEGYHTCMCDNGLPDDGYECFCNWLRDEKHQRPVEEDPSRYLQEFRGDHERAIAMYLDFIAEFSALDAARSMSAAEGGASSGGGGRETARSTLDYLLAMREEMHQGRLRVPRGGLSADRLNTLVDGYNACMEENGLSTEQYVRFRDWLRDVRGELPGEGWPAKYLQDFQGDQARAIRKYLDLVAEFVSLHAR